MRSSSTVNTIPRQRVLYKQETLSQRLCDRLGDRLGDMIAKCNVPADCIYPLCSCTDIQTPSGFISQPPLPRRPIPRLRGPSKQYCNYDNTTNSSKHFFPIQE